MDHLSSILDEAQNIADSNDFDFEIRDDVFDFPPSISNSSSNLLASAVNMAPMEPLSLEPTTTDAKPVVHKAAKTAKKRTWKKPKDKPKRPLSAYNLFFQHEREKIISSIPDDKAAAPVDNELSEEAKRRRHRKTHGKIGFAALARSIADKWKKIDEQSKSVFEARAEVEKIRYKKELDVWMKTRKEKGEPIKSKKKATPKAQPNQQPAQQQQATASPATENGSTQPSQQQAQPDTSMSETLQNFMRTDHQLRQQMLEHVMSQAMQQQQLQSQIQQQNAFPMGSNSVLGSFNAQQLLQGTRNFSMPPLQLPSMNNGMPEGGMTMNPLPGQCSVGNMGMQFAMNNANMVRLPQQQENFGNDQNVFPSVNMFQNDPSPILSCGVEANNQALQQETSTSTLEDDLTTFMNDFESDRL